MLFLCSLFFIHHFVYPIRYFREKGYDEISNRSNDCDWQNTKYGHIDRDGECTAWHGAANVSQNVRTRMEFSQVRFKIFIRAIMIINYIFKRLFRMLHFFLLIFKCAEWLWSRT